MDNIYHVLVAYFKYSAVVNILKKKQIYRYFHSNHLVYQYVRINHIKCFAIIKKKHSYKVARYVGAICGTFQQEHPWYKSLPSLSSIYGLT